VTGTHSILAPSDSARWLRCVGSLYLSRGLPDIDAEYNASGSCSHWLLEWGLTHPDLELDSWLGKTLTFGENPPFEFKIDEERLDRVRSCITTLNREPGIMFTERRLDTTPVLGVPNQEGHSDIIKAYSEGGVMKDGKLLKGVLSVHDYKDGWLLVKAKDNTQGLIYLCAAMIEFALVGEFEAFRFVIHQPKIHHYDEWTYTRAELESFMALIRPVAKLAYDLYHENTEFNAKEHLSAGEEQCLFCPVRGRCPARAARIVSMFEPLIKRHELDDKSVGMLYAQLDEIESAISDFRGEAIRRAKMGVKIEGHKLVYGNKGPRRWANAQKAQGALEVALGEKAFAPREIISPTQAEKLLKKAYEPLKEFVYQSDPQLRLVPLDHPGDEIKPVEFPPVQNEESLI
jgi:Protein of unknown function (DUF2800)